MIAKGLKKKVVLKKLVITLSVSFLMNIAPPRAYGDDAGVCGGQKGESYGCAVSSTPPVVLSDFEPALVGVSVPKQASVEEKVARQLLLVVQDDVLSKLVNGTRLDAE